MATCWVLKASERCVPLRSLAVIRDANVVQLDVDSEVDHVVGPVSLSPAHSPKPVFVGGAPGEPRVRTQWWSPVYSSGLPASCTSEQEAPSDSVMNNKHTCIESQRTDENIKYNVNHIFKQESEHCVQKKKILLCIFARFLVVVR